MGTFSKQLETFTKKSKVKADVVLRMSTLEVLKRVTLRSPVDTGRFISNWQVGVDDTPDGLIETIDKTGATVISAGEDELLSARIGKNVNIVNNLPYGPRLEDGWSERAANGMVAITVVEWPGIVADAIDAVK